MTLAVGYILVLFGLALVLFATEDRCVRGSRFRSSVERFSAAR
jgi:hypothetical protein